MLQHNAFPDAFKVKDKVYIAFRSANKHTPTTQSKIIVISTSNYKKWHIVKEFLSSNSDFRDPKIILYKGVLHLYWSVVFPTSKRFRPIGILHSVLKQDTTWSEPEFVYQKGYLISRVHQIRGNLYLCVYKWDSGRPFISEARIVTSTDGHSWNEFTPFGLLTEEGTESDCIEYKGNLIWLIRKDFAVHSNPGSTILVINRTGERIKRIYSPIKYDSPLLFSNHKQMYLLSRNQQSAKGSYYRGGAFLPKRLRTIGSYCLYWFTYKSTALWKIYPEELTISKILDLPSTGDTGYCGIVEVDHTLHVFNYSSPMENRKVSWRSGQSRSTSIYRYELQNQHL